MQAQEIINAIIENNNRNPIQQKVELKKESGIDFIKMEFGTFPNNTFIVKESSFEKEVNFEDLEKRCYQSILNYLVHKLINK